MNEPLTLIGVKLPRALAQELRRRAREDDRTVSAYVRRLLAATVESPTTFRTSAEADRERA